MEIIDNWSRLNISFIKNSSNIFKVFNKENFLFFGSGREAIVSLISSMEGNRTVLLPSWLPEGIYMPFIKLNWQIKQYKINKSGFPDFNHLELLLKKNRPLFAVIINYFGVSPDIINIKKICDKYGTYLFNDRAHSFPEKKNKFNEKTDGDVVLFSFPKLIGIPDGALLIINNSNLLHNVNRPRESIKHISYVIHSLYKLIYPVLTEKIRIKILKKVVVVFISFINLIIKDPYEILRSYFLKPAPMSGISKKILKHTNFNTFINKRRKFAELYYANLDKNKFKFIENFKFSNKIMIGFPVLIERRGKFEKYLAKQNIFGQKFEINWGYFPKEKSRFLKDANQLMNQHFLFPMNQKLKECQILKIIDYANLWEGK